MKLVVAAFGYCKIVKLDIADEQPVLFGRSAVLGCDVNIKQQAAVCRLVLSVCTGVFLLQAAGLLQGKRATTHWRQLERLRQCSEVTVVEARLVHDGTIWTAAGVTAGIDLALALIADQTDEETAGRVQLGAEYYPSQARYGKAHLEPQVPTYLKGHLPKKPTTLYESR